MNSSEALSHLTQNDQQKSLHHFFILTGAAETVKNLLHSFLQHSLQEEIPDISEVLHSQLYFLDFKNLKVQASEFKNLNARMVQTSAQKRFFILWNLDEASLILQNKILKTLEEPSPQLHFFAYAQSPWRLLPTVKGRGVTLSLESSLASKSSPFTPIPWNTLENYSPEEFLAYRQHLLRHICQWSDDAALLHDAWALYKVSSEQEAWNLHKKSALFLWFQLQERL